MIRDHRIRNAEPQPEDSLVVSVVYVTAAKTFDGPVGGYKTLNAPDDANPVAPVPTKATSPEQSEHENSPDQNSSSPTGAARQNQQISKSEQTSQQVQQTSMSEPTQTPSPSLKATDVSTSSSPSFSKSMKSSETSAAGSSAAKSYIVGNSSSRQTSSAPSSFTDQSAAMGPAATTSAVASTNKSSGIVGGAAAGLVLGILVIIGALILLFCAVRRKKNMKKSYAKTDDEKTAIGAQGGGVVRGPSTHSARTNASAPRLSLRPVTQFLPDLGGRGKNVNTLAADGPAHNSLNVPSDFSEKTTPSSQGGYQTNPFGPHAEFVGGAVQQIQTNQPANPFDNHAEIEHGSGLIEQPPVQAPAPLRVRTPTPDPSSANGVVAAAVAGGARDERYKAPNQLNVSPNRPGSPALSVATTEFSTTSVSPSYLANSPPLGNVHRIQLDFKPSMDDELGLQAGQLVRLLHEYDDGWVSFLVPCV